MIEHLDLIGTNIRLGHFGMNYNYSILFSERWRLGDMRTLTQAYNMSIINTKRTVEGSLDWQKSSKVVRLETVTSFKHYSFKIQFLTTVSYYKNLEIEAIGNRDCVNCVCSNCVCAATPLCLLCLRFFNEGGNLFHLDCNSRKHNWTLLS